MIYLEAFNEVLDYIPEIKGSSIVYLLKKNPKVIIDTGGSPKIGIIIIERLNQINHPMNEQIYVFLTHYHGDHVQGFNILSERLKIFAYYQTEKPPFHDEECEKINDQQFIQLGDYKFKIIFTPGHTKESICIYEENNKILFTGDTIFVDGEIGWGNSKEIQYSIKKLLDLDVDIIAPGHVYPLLKGKEHVKMADEKPWTT
ncbi:MAG: MBL fold metallo-hydrolase [Candidatus Lokiarchaeota archaeon]|nr:MBL fold metallo-hydrolase [Candidatus Lokiarchaeota archaeon]